VAQEYTHVRIETATLAELERVRQSMLLGEMMGARTLIHDPRHRVSLSQVIAELIRFREKHKDRVRKAKARRTALRRAAASTDEAPITVPLLCPAPVE
jgi:hypothetical protein